MAGFGSKWPDKNWRMARIFMLSSGLAGPLPPSGQNRPEFPWQKGLHPLEEPIRACRPVLARPCALSENTERKETIPFPDILWIA
jgi:hypothetical protein